MQPSGICQAYDALGQWIDKNDYQIIGPAGELNLKLPEPVGSQDDPNTVNEIQFPMEKVKQTKLPAAKNN